MRLTRLGERMEQWPLHRARDAERGPPADAAHASSGKRHSTPRNRMNSRSGSSFLGGSLQGSTDVEKGLDLEIVGEIAERGRINAGP